MAAMMLRIRIWLTADRGDRGASLVEYALLVALIALVCFAAIGFLGGETSSHFEKTGNSLNTLN
jgi:pilus assembly protein Flp/PilA